MAITSGVRAPRAQITIGGQSFNVLSARVNQEATRRSSTMSASCALNTFPGGDAFFAGLSDNAGSISIDGVPLVTGEWDGAIIGYGETIVQLTGKGQLDFIAELFHVLHMAYEESKKLADELLDEE